MPLRFARIVLNIPLNRLIGLKIQNDTMSGMTEKYALRIFIFPVCESDWWSRTCEKCECNVNDIRCQFILLLIYGCERTEARRSDSKFIHFVHVRRSYRIFSSFRKWCRKLHLPSSLHRLIQNNSSLKNEARSASNSNERVETRVSSHR